MIIYSGKAKDLTLKELYFGWMHLRQYEKLEPADFKDMRN